MSVSFKQHVLVESLTAFAIKVFFKKKEPEGQ